MRSYSEFSRAVIWATLPSVIVRGFTISNGILGKPSKCLRSKTDSKLSSNFGGDEDQVVEALRSLVDFHEGKWRGKARSFAVLPDTTAGVVQRKVSPDYEVSVKLGLDADREYSLTETFSWGEENVKARLLRLSQCSVDVDSVDASYSLDVALPDFPADIIGTNKICQFVIEHCIAASEDKRMRCFIFYNMEQTLQRVVYCEETRIGGLVAYHEMDDTSSAQGDMTHQVTAQDLIEMQNDVDRLVEKLTGSMKSYETPVSSPPALSSSVDAVLGQNIVSDDGARELMPHNISLLEASSGIWLGDAIIRDNLSVRDSSSSIGRGFGDRSSAKVSSSTTTKKNFANWSVGVQKVAWRWMWNFGEEIRQVVDVGKALGGELSACLSKSQPGSVCVNESLSRRTAKEERMVYIDWAANMVGFLVGPVYIHVPRYLSFDQRTTNPKPFFTEFALFQATERKPDGTNDMPSDMASDDNDMALPSLCFSKVSRVYNSDGHLKQGSTSFYTFKRFGIDDEMDK